MNTTETHEHVEMSAVIDTNVLIRAARLNLGIGGPLDRKDRELFAAASQTLKLMGRPLQFDGCTVTFRPVVNATVVGEITKVLTDSGCSVEQINLVHQAVKNLLTKTGGAYDNTGKGNVVYAKSMSKRSRDNWGTGAGDEAVLDTALRYSAVIVTEDGNFTDYARHRGVHVYSTRELAGIEVAVTKAA